ncbi:hypothetical protein QE152_g7756 [Popillia japonica]|uniref:Uncharacterized protein n=1 Tax=Popillia japonica TaxID=7064 RepID=A0AAW1MDN3_POPJA
MATMLGYDDLGSTTIFAPHIVGEIEKMANLHLNTLTMDASAGPSKAVKYDDPEFEQIVTEWYNDMDSDVDDCDEDFCTETMEDSSDDSENEEVHEIVT